VLLQQHSDHLESHTKTNAMHALVFLKAEYNDKLDLH
jgi:hypothetical protein